MSEPAGDSDHTEVERPTGRRRDARVVVPWIVAAPAIGLALCAMAGIGMLRGLGPLAAFAGALLLVALPAAGLGTAARSYRAATAVGAGVWSLAVVLALPAYFPGERGRATALGLETLAAPAGQRAARRLAETGEALVRSLGSDGARPAEVVRSTERSPMEPASRPRATTAITRPAEPTRAPATVMLPYEGDETSLRVRIDFDGPEVGEQLEMIFDTGATFTTLDRRSLERIGVEIDTDAPWITLRTANGEIEAPLVLIDAVWLGDATVEWVTVAVCDSCANPPIAGLLGLNVTGRFRVSLDHDRRRIELAPRRRGGDRALDVGQWLEIRSRARRDWTGAVEVSLRAANRSRQPVEETVIDLSCGDQTFAIQIDDIPARGERTTEVALPHGTDCSHQTASVSRGRWLLDRF